MTIDAIVTMVVVLGGVWGGFAFLIIRVLRKEKKDTITYPGGPPLRSNY